MALVAASCISGATAFSPVKPMATATGNNGLFMSSDIVGSPPEGWQEVKELYPPEEFVPDFRVEGGNTLKTFKMPAHAERVQYVLASANGRPMKARVELWIGPLRCVHTLIADNMNGESCPIKATLKFKKLAPTLKISNNGEFEFPLAAGVFVPTPERSAELGALTQEMWDTSPKVTVQGGPTTGGLGSVRTYEIDPSWDNCQLMFWSVDVGSKSVKAAIEVIQGPNNTKQIYDLQIGGSTQPFHAVINTPGEGWRVRVFSKKFLEDGKFQFAVAPYTENEFEDDSPNPGVSFGSSGGW